MTQMTHYDSYDSLWLMKTHYDSRRLIWLSMTHMTQNDSYDSEWLIWISMTFMTHFPKNYSSRRSMGTFPSSYYWNSRHFRSFYSYILREWYFQEVSSSFQWNFQAELFCNWIATLPRVSPNHYFFCFSSCCHGSSCHGCGYSCCGGGCSHFCSNVASMNSYKSLEHYHRSLSDSYRHRAEDIRRHLSIWFVCYGSILLRPYDVF